MKADNWFQLRIVGVTQEARSSHRAFFVVFLTPNPPPRRNLSAPIAALGLGGAFAPGFALGIVIAIALEAGLPIPPDLQRLGTDGCGEDDVIQEGWPVIRHFLTSQLRWAFGYDEEPVGMSQDVQEFLPEATFDYEETL